ncbi:unnamed protein product [Ilex paraguariensis]|uniref:Uncharacterized protein n=1 Tax=Ilex paraguariensis TaxID=185542 RepID=A0ABC8S5W7_9AQUA
MTGTISTYSDFTDDFLQTKTSSTVAAPQHSSFPLFHTASSQPLGPDPTNDIGASTPCTDHHSLLEVINEADTTPAYDTHPPIHEVPLLPEAAQSMSFPTTKTSQPSFSNEAKSQSLVIATPTNAELSPSTLPIVPESSLSDLMVSCSCLTSLGGLPGNLYIDFTSACSHCRLLPPLPLIMSIPMITRNKAKAQQCHTDFADSMEALLTLQAHRAEES